MSHEIDHVHGVPEGAEPCRVDTGGPTDIENGARRGWEEPAEHFLGPEQLQLPQTLGDATALLYSLVVPGDLRTLAIDRRSIRPKHYGRTRLSATSVRRAAFGENLRRRRAGCRPAWPQEVGQPRGCLERTDPALCVRTRVVIFEGSDGGVSAGPSIAEANLKAPEE